MSGVENPRPGLEARIREARAKLGPSVVILGHHYQRDDVIQFADYRGDSLRLACEAAGCREAKFIVFCGVHFMAETAAILSQPGQTVLLPAPEAGCPLAQMASPDQVEGAWAQLGDRIDVDSEVMPVTYVNSAAALKAFCGRHGGLVCTSSNAREALDWAMSSRPRVLFFPDQHLGRNTAKSVGLSGEDLLLWNPVRPLGGHFVEEIRRARVFLWRGWCSVHQRFLPEDVSRWREREPGIRILVHPECREETVDLADESGSTAYIIRRVEESAPGAKWAIGTEANLVNRLKSQHPEQFIASLSPEPSYCRTMNLTTQALLVEVLEGLLCDRLVNPIEVSPQVAGPARVALERMLELGQ